MDEDLESLSREQLAAEIKKLRSAVRVHRDSTGQGLCWHQPNLWSLFTGQSLSIGGNPGLAAVHERLRQIPSIS